ncbi:unnamed protein product [Miscanthus lutarioriparius]|uniref:Uncharacterized protein n=1 Tax=Miscanthus lutarioriparius TaxID=422564 RepID=A0A811RM47_9POAL|nr:unnamed protein product [Miscanthus lutarioriparius]
MGAGRVCRGGPSPAAGAATGRPFRRSPRPPPPPLPRPPPRRRPRRSSRRCPRPLLCWGVEERSVSCIVVPQPAGVVGARCGGEPRDISEAYQVKKNQMLLDQLFDLKSKEQELQDPFFGTLLMDKSGRALLLVHWESMGICESTLCSAAGRWASICSHRSAVCGFASGLITGGLILLGLICTRSRLTQMHCVLCPVSQNARQLLSECVASHLRHKDVALEYGSGLQSSSGRILLQSLPGTKLYRERFVRALANELIVAKTVQRVRERIIMQSAEVEDKGSESEVDGKGDESDDDGTVQSE